LTDNIVKVKMKITPHDDSKQAFSLYFESFEDAQRFSLFLQELIEKIKEKEAIKLDGKNPKDS